MEHSYVAIVSNETEQLSKYVENALIERTIPVIRLTPGDLGDLQTSLQEEVFKIKGLQIRGLFFRVPTHSAFCLSFILEDQPFCDAEVRAAWLAACHLDSVLAINRYDAAAWFEGASWPIWRRKLIKARIPVSPFEMGDINSTDSWSWYPYGSCIPRSAPTRTIRRIFGTALTQRNQKNACLIVYNEVFSGKVNKVVLETYKLLETNGVCIAEISTDYEDNVICVNTQPKIDDDVIAEQVAQLIAGKLYEHLYRR